MGQEKPQQFYPETDQLFDKQALIESIKERFSEIDDPQYNKELLTPRKAGAVLREEACFAKRNDAIRTIEGLGGDKQAKNL